MGRPSKVSPQVAGPASICNAITDTSITDTFKNVNLFSVTISFYSGRFLSMLSILKDNQTL